MATLETQIIRILKTQFSFLSGNKIIIACSGGLDSSALVHLMASTAQETGILPLAAYINHQTRKENSQEADFVQTLANRYSIPFLYDELAPDFWNQGTANLEEKARRERYRLLIKTAKKEDIPFIATGHHQDDQAETILMRLLGRGTGIRGLAGIRRILEQDGISIVRPFLDISRERLDEYMKDKAWCFDPSNRNQDLERNFYRQTVIPSIEKLIGAGFKSNCGRLAAVVQAEEAFSKETASLFWQSFVTPDGYSVPRQVLEKYSSDFWETAFSHLFNQIKGFSHEKETLADLARYIMKKEPSTCYYAPLTISRTRDGISLSIIPTPSGA